MTFHIGNRKTDLTPRLEDAADALAAVRDSRLDLAHAANCPPIRHWAFGGIMGALVATPALPFGYALVAEALLLVAIALVVQWDRRRTGMFINGYRSGRTRPITFAMLLAFLALYALGVWLSRDLHLRWAPVALGGVVAVIAYAASVQWQRIFRRELGLDA